MNPKLLRIMALVAIECGRFLEPCFGRALSITSAIIKSSKITGYYTKMTYIVRLDIHIHATSLQKEHFRYLFKNISDLKDGNSEIMSLKCGT